jgi:UDP-N-acetylmuramate--alanine ligase
MLRAEEVRPDAGGCRFRVRERGRVLGEASLRTPGLHNLRNALAAVAVARRFGAEWDAIAAGIAAYTGVDRRFETVGEADGVLLVDDYAHHPTELRATLEAARTAHPERRLVAVFQPHLYSRTRDFQREFGGGAGRGRPGGAHRRVRRPRAPIEGVSGTLIADAARAAGAHVRYVADRAEVVDAVAAELRPGDLCLTLGAGNLDIACRELLERLSGAAVEAR